MRELGLPLQTLFADLIQRGLDAEFDREFPESGQFKARGRGGRRYWYFQTYDGQRQTEKYVGPADDPDIASRVDRFTSLKADFAERRRSVAALKATGLPAPDDLAGDLLEALWKAGVFRLRCVLVGTIAFHTYAGLLGVRLPAAQTRTGDLDLAQFHSISVLVDDGLPPILDVLRSVDPTFAEVPHEADGRLATRFRNSGRYLVEFLVPNRGSSDFDGHPAPMPALGGAAAQPLRFLDFLIYQPVRSVVLHKGGIPVLVPAPERYAVHKLIVAVRRRNDPLGVVKADKDIAQAALLIEALAPRRALDLVDAWAEAWERGPKWREALVRGRARLPVAARRYLEAAVTSAGRELGRDPAALGFAPAAGGSSE